MDDSIEGTKKRRYAKLNIEMEKLSENLLRLQKTVEVTTSQVPAMSKLGSFHASIMLASKGVINESCEKTQIKESDR